MDTNQYETSEAFTARGNTFLSFISVAPEKRHFANKANNISIVPTFKRPQMPDNDGQTEIFENI